MSARGSRVGPRRLLVLTCVAIAFAVLVVYVPPVGPLQHLDILVLAGLFVLVRGALWVRDGFRRDRELAAKQTAGG